MGIVSTTGIGSGIDIQTLSSQLAKAEAQPALNAISRKKDTANTRLSGLGTLKSALSDFRTVITKLKDGSLFEKHKAVSSDESVFKVTAGLGSVAGSYAVKVNQLAKAQKSITTAEFANSSALVGNGTLNFATTGGSSFSVTTNDTTTLEGLRDAINRANDNSSVTASIINVDSGTSGTISKLVLTAKNAGAANAFTVTGTEGSMPGLSRFFTTNLQAQTTAANAIIEVDGQTATRSTNTISDVLPGVTIDLKKASAGSTVNIDVSLDSDSIKTTINEFVAAFNKFSSTAKSLGKYGGSTDGSGSGNGPLIGNSTLRMVSDQLRQEATNIVSSTTSNYNSLAMIGISIKDGTMSLNSTKLEAALNADLQSVSDVFSSSAGVAVRMDSKLNSFLQSGGPLDSQQNSLKKQISALDSQQIKVQERQSNYEAMLLKQFTAMDVSVGAFNSTSTFLNNWISNNQ